MSTDLEDGDDDTKQANSTAKDFNDENSDKQSGILSISQSRSRSDNANTDTTEQV